MTQSLMERMSVVTVLAASSDRYDANPETSVIDMAKVHKVTFLIDEGASTGGQARVVLQACTGSTGGGPTAIGYRYKTRATSQSTWSDWTTVTSSGALTLGDLSGLTGFAVQVSAKDIVAAGSSATFRYAQLALTEAVNTPIPASIIAVLEPRYYGQAQPDSIA